MMIRLWLFTFFEKVGSLTSVHYRFHCLNFVVTMGNSHQE